MGFYVMLRGAEKLVPAEYWYPYGTWDLLWLMVGCCNDGRGLTPSSPPPPRYPFLNYQMSMSNIINDALKIETHLHHKSYLAITPACFLVLFY